MSLNPRYKQAFLPTALLCALVFSVLLVLPKTVALPLVAEGGLIETLSALCYFAGALLLILKARISLWPFVIMLLAFGLRELDMDKSFFTEGLLKSRQYIGGSVSLSEKLFSAGILIALLCVVALILKRGLFPFLRGLKAGDWRARTIGFVLVLGLAAKGVDGIDRKLADFGIAASDTVNNVALYFEETAEFGMATGLLLVCVIFVLQSRVHLHNERGD